MKIYKIAQTNFQYLGQCDKMRCDQIGEDNWQNMIQNHHKVSLQEFESNCNTEAILEDGETLEEIIADDPSSYFAKSMWGNQSCYYMMTKGFELIFVEEDIHPEERLMRHILK